MLYDCYSLGSLQKLQTYLRATKVLDVYCIDQLVETLGSKLKNVYDLLEVSRGTGRYFDYWDLGFPVMCYKSASGMIPVHDAKRFVITSIDHAKEIISESANLDVTDDLVSNAITHPWSHKESEFIPDKENPKMKFALKKLMFQLEQGEISSIEEGFLNLIMQGQNQLMNQATAHIIFKSCKNFKLASYAPFSVLFYSTETYESLSQMLEDFKFSHYIKVIEVEENGLNWFLQNYE